VYHLGAEAKIIMVQAKKSRARGGARTTVDHDEIRRWVEERGGKPAVVKTTANDDPGILRIDFPGFSGEQSLEELAWDDWFERFDSAKLAFLYQDETGSGDASRFNKLVSRETAELGSKKANGRKRGSTRRSAATTRRGRTSGGARKRAGSTASGNRRARGGRATAAKGKKSNTTGSKEAPRSKRTTRRATKRPSAARSGRAKKE
jgi:hypothetical protein